MKTKRKIVVVALLALSVCGYAQMGTLGNTANRLTGENVFMDGTVYSDGYNNNVGKGIAFPTTDLTQWEFVTTTMSDLSLSTFYDGLIVYNTATGQTKSGQGVQVNVRPGFYYFSNPTGSNTDKINKGQWIPVKDIINGTNAPTGTGNAGDVYVDSNTGDIYTSDGTGWTKVGNSSLSLWDADDDTGIQMEESADEDKIRFDTAGNERMIIDNLGNVGIGTDAPNKTLTVNGTARIMGLPEDTSENTPILIVDGSGELKKSERYWFKGESRTPSTTNVFTTNMTATQASTYSSFGADRAINGNTSSLDRSLVGSGSGQVYPWWRLDMGSEITINRLKLYQYTSSQDRLSDFYIVFSKNDINLPTTPTAGDITSLTGDSNNKVFYYSGIYPSGTDFTLEDVSAQYMIIVRNISTASYLQIAEVEAYADTVTTSDDVIGTPKSKVGINTKDPTETLDVNGEVKIRTLGSGDATSDEVVVADGNGVLKKVSASSLQTQVNTDNQDLSTSFNASTGKLSLGLTGDSNANNNAEIDLSGLRDGDAWGVAGEDTSSVVTRSGKVNILGSASPQSGMLEVGHSSNTQKLLFGYEGISKGGSNANGNLKFDAKGTGHVLLNTTATGNVGIGTTSPTAKLHVAPSGAEALLLGRTSGKANLKAAGSNQWLIMDAASGTGNVGLAYYEGSDVILNNAGGNTGIGTTAPAQKLHVAGGARVTTMAAGSVSGTTADQIVTVNSSGDLRKVSASSLQTQVNTDNQDLSTSFNASTGKLSLGLTGDSNANNNAEIDLSGLKDNLGNHTATTNLNMGGHQIKGSGGHTNIDGLEVGTIISGWSGISHASNANGTNYALIQNADGRTILNAKAGQVVNFRQGNADKMIINAAGNVGIGTTTPDKKLDVVGSVKASDNILIGNTNGDDDNLFRLDGYGNKLYVIAEGGSGGAATDINFRTALAGQSATDKMVIKSGGNVGIGTTAPNDRLHIKRDWFDTNTNTWGGGLKVEGTKPSVSFWETDNGEHRWMFHLDNDNFRLYRRPKGGSFQHFWSVSNQGNFGIGTTTPAQKLHVVGGARVTTMAAGSVSGTTADQIVTVNSSGDLRKVSASSLQTQVNTDNQDLSTSFNASTGKLSLGLTGDSNANNNAEIDLSGLRDGDAWGVAGEDTSSVVTRSGKVNILGSASPQSGMLEVGHSNNTQKLLFGYEGISKGGSNANGNLKFDAKGTGHVLLNTTATGNVGIGTTSPAQKLHVAGGARVTTMAAGSVSGTTADQIVTVNSSGDLRKVSASSLQTQVNTDSQDLSTSFNASTAKLSLGLTGDSNANNNAELDLSGLKDGDAWGVAGEDISSAISRTGKVAVGQTAFTKTSTIAEFSGGDVLIAGSQSSAAASPIIPNSETIQSTNVRYINAYKTYAFNADLFDGNTESSGASFHLNRATAGQDWGIALTYSKSYTFSNLRLQTRVDCCFQRAGGGIFQIYNNGQLVYTSPTINSPSSGSSWTSNLNPNVVGNEVRYIFPNGRNTQFNDGTFNLSELQIVGAPANSGTNLFFADASEKRIGVGTDAPSQALDVNGQLRVRTLSNTGIANHSVVVADGTGVLKKTTLSDIQDGTGTDDQQIQKFAVESGNIVLNLEGGGQKSIPISSINTDNQKLSVPTPTDDTKVEIKLEDGGSVTLKEGNNIQLSQTRGTNEIVIEATASGGGTNTDNQNLSVNTATANNPVLQIERGNDVTFRAGTNVNLGATGNSITINAEDKQTINTMSMTNDKLSIGISGGNSREVDLSSLRAQLSAGSGVSISGSGTSASPYTISANGGSGSGDGDAWAVTGEDRTSKIIRFGAVRIGLSVDKKQNPKDMLEVNGNITGGNGPGTHHVVLGKIFSTNNDDAGWAGLSNASYQWRNSTNNGKGYDTGGYFVNKDGALRMAADPTKNAVFSAKNFNFHAGGDRMTINGPSANNFQLDVVSDGTNSSGAPRKATLNLLNDYTSSYLIGKKKGFFIETSTYYQLGNPSITQNVLQMGMYKADGVDQQPMFLMGEHGMVMANSGGPYYPGDSGNLLRVYGSAWKNDGSSSWSTGSDRRIKDNISPYQKGLSDLLKVNPVTYTYNEKAGVEDTSKEHVGIIAQDIEKVFPNTVTKTDETAGPSGLKDKRNFDNSELLYTLINAVKELKAENDALKERIEALEGKN